MEKNSFTTIIGFQFLQQLRIVIIQSGLKKEEELLPIKLNGIETSDKEKKRSLKGKITEQPTSSMSTFQNKKIEKYKQIAEKYQTANKTKNTAG